MDAIRRQVSFDNFLKLPLLVGALIGLSACDGVSEQWAENQVEAAHARTQARLMAQGNPQFSDPEKAKIVQQFEQDFAQYGRDVGKVRAGAAATACSLEDKEHAFYLVRGKTVDAVKSEYAHIDMAHAPDLESIRIYMVSGSCDDLRESGEVEYVAEMRAASRIGSGEAMSSFLLLEDSTFRIRGQMRDGERHGAFRTIEIEKSTRMDRGDSGEFEVTRRDWEHLNSMLDAPMAIYTYETFGAGASPKLTFIRQPERNLFQTRLEEPQSDGLVRGTTYNGTELRTRYSTRNGMLHGLYEILGYTENGITISPTTKCYQNGEEVRATQCPTN